MPSALPPTFVAEPDGPPLDAAAVAAALRRGWRLILGAVVVALGAAGAYVALRPPVYEATGYAFVRTAEAARSTETIEDVLLGGMGQSRTLANELGVLRRSLDLATGVVERVGPDRVAADLQLEATAPGVARPATPRVLAAALLKARVTFEQAEDENDLVAIAVRSGDARLAADVANAFAEAYAERSRSNGQASMTTSAAFLEGQLEDQRDELSEIEGQLEAYMERNRAVALDTEGQTAVTQLAEVDAAIHQAAVDLEVERTALAGAQSEAARVLPGLARRIGSPVEVEIAILQRRLADFDAQATDYYAHDPTLRGDEGRNPELAVLRDRRRAAAERIGTLSSRLVDEVMAVGGADSRSEGGDLATTGLPYATRMQREATVRGNTIRGLEARRQTLEAQRAGFEGQLGSLPSRAVGLARLERARQAAERTFFFLSEKLQQARVAAESGVAYVEVVRPAAVPTRPVAPDPVRTLGLGGLLGLLAGAGFALVRHTADRRLRTAAEVEALGLPVLGTVPAFDARALLGLQATLPIENGGDVRADIVAALLPSGPLVETFRSVRWSVQHSRAERPRVVLVTSPGEGEGKTTVAVHLALAAARAGLRTLYVDADLRRPTGHERFGIARESGLTELLFAEGPVAWGSFRFPLRADWDFFDADLHTLYVLPAGRPVPNPPELLGSDRARRAFAEMRATFDLVVVDSPPVGPVVDALELGAACDGVVLVAGAGSTEADALSRARLLFDRQGGTPVLGVVLNRSEGGSTEGKGYGYASADYGADVQAAPPRLTLDWTSGDGALHLRPPVVAPAPVPVAVPVPVAAPAAATVSASAPAPAAPTALCGRMEWLN